MSTRKIGGRAKSRERCLWHKSGERCPFAILTDGVVRVDTFGCVTCHAPTAVNLTFCRLSGMAGCYTGDKRLAECTERGA